MKKKLVGIIVFSAVVLSGGIFLAHESISSNDSKDWKTYRNDEFGFEFKYPEELCGGPNFVYPETLSKIIATQDEGESKLNVTVLCGGEREVPQFSVSVFDNKPNYSDEDYERRFWTLVDWRIARVISDRMHPSYETLLLKLDNGKYMTLSRKDVNILRTFRFIP